MTTVAVGAVVVIGILGAIFLAPGEDTPEPQEQVAVAQTDTEEPAEIVAEPEAVPADEPEVAEETAAEQPPVVDVAPVVDPEPAPEPEAVDEPEEPAAAPVETETAEAPVIAAPTIEDVRIEADGMGTIAGRFAAGGRVDVMLDDVILQSLETDGDGSFFAFFTLEPSDQPRQLYLVADPEGDALVSEETVLIGADVVKGPQPAEETAETAEEQQLALAEVNTEQPERPATPETETPVEVASDEPAAEETVAAGAEEEPTADVAEPAEATRAEEPVAEETIEVAEVNTDEPAAPAEETTEVAEAAEPTVTEEQPAQEQPNEETTELTGVEEVEDTTSDTVLLADNDGVRVVQSGDEERSPSVTVDTITYNDEGNVSVSGRASGQAGNIQLYLDNTPLVSAPIEQSGDWRTDLPEVETGVYTLRADETDEAGEVVSRIETPFKREDPTDIATAIGVDESDDGISVKVVQPGNSLWRIARAAYGDGVKYVYVFEANKDLIRDPDLIYPGQVFVLPELEQE
ncbi:LysM peptidoglycan-binding domain-containing protein [Marivivens donghaensis]|uniref:LysM peptidoglycan-binding domain-containing protein n=1 Tax=Marivivens donghaensis TaxID=1699413 RepID=A0ABX0VYC4_9RHOB|nr:LysM peptidoglycan-binding domain-containing protein [Marivivens donghaensis]NIY73064.1 LysM peptidoglycan-binding domain-containing protein [Marivivens donghaensis]